ncbi:MAG: 16S rRNA (uracil(1498)-N(3))-methyltransferase [Gemmatales bacterium]|nr:16S rRNA (uracil(1498)-N(3))-methyltransferase [Gemmatales bacterium]MDW7994719.1 16S rRNA (uracil(1498)-N(3))-methyltransferase [Gemmatales bacterium]
MAERFFYPGPIDGALVHLSGEEMHHMIHVCRLGIGDRVILFNGDGREYQAVIRNIRKREVELAIESVAEVSRELPLHIHVAAPLPKADRAHFLVEKLTELGVACYQPLLTSRSVIEPRPTRLEKLRRYVVEACKQCGRNRLMEIAPPVTFEQLLIYSRQVEGKLLADPEGKTLREVFCPGWSRVVVAIGPEGGFTTYELRQAHDQGWHMVSLGPTVLRIETAALTMTAGLVLLCQQKFFPMALDSLDRFC